MSNLSLIMYVEIDALCILLLVYIIIKSFNNVEKRESWRFFQWAICFIVMFVFCDLVWKLMECNVLPNKTPLPYLINFMYFAFSMAGTASWYFYTECELETDLAGKNRSFMIAFTIPTAIIAILLIVSYFNGCMFYFDEQGVYQRGPLHIIGFIAPLFYLVVGMIRCLVKIFKKENYAKRANYLNLALFTAITAFFCVLQIFIMGTPLPCIGITTAVIMAYVNNQETLVSLDALTKLNNRYQMMRYLSYKMEHAETNTLLYLLIIDLDKFKGINDTYGHVEGDKALVRIAAILRRVAAAFNCFVARYGGDEFIIIFETDNENEITDLCDFVHRKIDESNRESDAPYKLSASIGYAKYESDIRYIPEFIERADTALYKVKKEKKRQYR